jgi:hypothetical protein
MAQEKTGAPFREVDVVDRRHAPRQHLGGWLIVSGDHRQEGELRELDEILGCPPGEIARVEARELVRVESPEPGIEAVQCGWRPVGIQAR